MRSIIPRIPTMMVTVPLALVLAMCSQSAPESDGPGSTSAGTDGSTQGSGAAPAATTSPPPGAMTTTGGASTSASATTADGSSATDTEGGGTTQGEPSDGTGAGTSETPGDETGGTAGGGSTDGGDVDPYASDCNAERMCDGTPVCVASANGEDGFCAPRCVAEGDPSACPESPGGTAFPVCIQLSTRSGNVRHLCALDCANGRTCPDGMKCLEEVDDNGPIRVCF